MTSDRIVHKAEAATSDIDGLVDYFLRAAGHAVALRFVDHAERAFDQLLTMPKIGADWMSSPTRMFGAGTSRGSTT